MAKSMYSSKGHPGKYQQNANPSLDQQQYNHFQTRVTQCMVMGCLDKLSTFRQLEY